MRSLIGALVVSCVVATLCVGGQVASASTITGNPSTDGWTHIGHSLERGFFVSGDGNYGFDLYSTLITVGTGSDLEIADGTNSWRKGDTVLGAGGTFATITAAEAGWSAISGVSVNSVLSVGMERWVAFGSTVSSYVTSPYAPAFNTGANHGTYSGVGAVRIESYTTTDHAYWSGGSGRLNELVHQAYIYRQSADRPDKDVARMSWVWDATRNYVTSWEFLLNISLLERLDAANGTSTNRILPGGQVLMTVERGGLTSALVNTPEQTPVVPLPAPAALGLLGMGIAVALRKGKRSRRTG